MFMSPIPMLRFVKNNPRRSRLDVFKIYIYIICILLF